MEMLTTNMLLAGDLWTNIINWFAGWIVNYGWTIIVFTTSVMAFDIAVLLISLIFTKLKKQTIIFVLSPIIFFLAMLPKNFIQINNFAKYMSYIEIIYIVFVTFLLGTMLLIKGVRTNDSI